MLLDQIKQIFEWNDKVNELFSREVWEYNFEKLFQGMNIFNEESFETILAAIKWNKIEIADWLWDMFFVAVWELQKQWVSAEQIDRIVRHWELQWIPYDKEARKSFLIIDMAFGSENTEKIIQEIIDSNNTRFTDGCCIRDGKFIKGKEYRKPNFSFL